MKIGIKNVVKNIINAAFPANCRGCGEKGEFLCERCKKYISENMKVREIEGAVFLGFRDEILGEMIEEAKYESVRGLLMEIAEVVYRGYFENLKGAAVLVPMPTSRKHVRERAIDHMDVICREVARRSGGKIEKVRLLKRAKDTVQVGASSAVRRKQAKEAVELDEKVLRKYAREVRERQVILMDDVWTTGASLTEAGKILKKAGASSLTLLTITKNRPRKRPVIRRGEID